MPALAAATVVFVGFSDTHVQPHLVIGDVEAGQMLIPQLLRRIRTLPQTCPTARRVFKKRRRVRSAVGRAPPSLRQTAHGGSLTLIDAEFSP